jgi:REP element-mobilizing transposase RayT
MSRPLRLLTPATTWFVTTRCIDAKLLLRPDPALNAAVGLSLARAARRHPGISLFGFVALSNHLHLLLTDERSELSSFMELFLGTLAKSVNALRNRRGHVFERRFSAEPVLDPVALLDRWQYLVLNPVRAGLVSHHDDWPGLCLLAAGAAPTVHAFRRFRHDRYDAARRAAPKGKSPPSPSDFYEEASVRIQPLPAQVLQMAGLPEGRTLWEELRRLEVCIAQERRRQGRGFLGRERVLAQDPFTEPKNPKRSPRPLCHTSFSGLYFQFREMLRSLTRFYAECSSRYRRGEFSIEFPPFTFRPSVPLLSTA